MLFKTTSSFIVALSLVPSVYSVSSISFEDCDDPVPDKSLCVDAYEKEFGPCENFNALYENLDRIWSNNAENVSYKLGVNRFSSKPFHPPPKQQVEVSASPKMVEAPDFPRSKDWRTSINNPVSKAGQGGCGDCCGVASIEYAYAITYQLANAIQFSTEYAMSRFYEPEDSTYNSNACRGGDPFDVIKGAHDVGLPLEKDYIYHENPEDVPQTLSGDFIKTSSVTNWSPIRSNDDLAAAVSKQPVSVYFMADSSFMNYNDGVYEPSTCNNSVNHGFLVLGYDMDQKYWIIRNSWGTWWGDNGFGKIRMSDDNTGPCGMFQQGYLAPPLQFSKTLSGTASATNPSPAPKLSPQPTPNHKSSPSAPKPNYRNPSPSTPKPSPFTPSPSNNISPAPACNNTSPPPNNAQPSPSPSPSDFNRTSPSKNSTCQGDKDLVKLLVDVEGILTAIMKKL